jgi:hypothetical protein
MTSEFGSERGKDMFKDEFGYFYACNNKSKDGKKVYWLCVNRKSCKVRIHMTDGVVVWRSEDHTQSAEPTKYVAKKMAPDTAATSATTNNTTRNIISNGVQNVGAHVAASLPSRESLCRCTQRARRHANPMTPVPTKRSGYDILERYSKTSDGR